MKPAERVMQAGATPWAAAIELIRRHGQSSELETIAKQWLGLLRQVPSLAPPAHSDLAKLRPALAAMCRAVSPAPRTDVAARCVRAALAHSGDIAHFEAFFACYEAPSEADAEAALLAWAASQPRRTRSLLAFLWSDDNAALGLALLGDPDYARPDCDCGEAHPIAKAHAVLEHLLFILCGREARRPMHELERRILAQVPIDAWLEDQSLNRYAWLLLLAEADLGWVVGHARSRAVGPKQHLGALWLLCGAGESKLVVDTLATAARSAAPGENVLRELLSGDRGDPLRGGPFQGRGWGKRDRASLLLPLTRALLDRGDFPARDLRACLEQRGGADNRGDRAEQAWRHVLIVLGEGLLDLARDRGMPLVRRGAAVSALGVLGRSSNGWPQALTKMRSSELTTEIDAVLGLWKREQPLDAELAVLDAVELLETASERNS